MTNTLISNPPRPAIDEPAQPPTVVPVISAPAGDLWSTCSNALKLQKQAPPMVRVSRSQPVPLSFAQQRLWLLQYAHPESTAYNLAFAWRISGPLNVTALDQSFQALVQRHEIFRTTFVFQDGHPLQIIAPSIQIGLQSMNLETVPIADREAELQRLLRQKAQQVFDLSSGPLWGAFLFQMQHQEYVLLLVMHHILCDGPSLAPLFRELQVFYSAFSTGQAASLPALPVQYADFATWQRSWMKDEVLAEQFAYWKQKLAGPPPALELPADRSRPAQQSFRGAAHFFQWPTALSEAIQGCKKQENTTAFNVLLAGFHALLYRYTGQEELVVGALTGHRPRSELRPLIGFFVNTLVLRTPVQGDWSFRQLLTAVRQTTLDAFSNPDVPFDRLVEELKPERDRSHSPLFQVLFSFQSLPRRGLELPGLRVEMLEFDPGAAKYDLMLDVNETLQGIRGFFEYNTDLFDESTIRRMAGHLQRLISAALAQPDQPLWALPMMSEEERHQVVVDWNQQSSEYPQDACLHELIEAQVARTPEAVALVAGERRVSYAQLNQQANQLARYLQKLQVGPEIMVGICLERSVEMVVAMLAVLKAGGAYVPLDPAYPPHRLTYALQDTRAPVLLTQSRFVAEGLMPSGANPGDPKVLCLDEDWPKLAEENGENLPRTAGSQNLAYVIYTSGSTGRPKGVVLEHRNAVSFVHWVKETYSLDVLAGVLFATSICFDVSIFELFATLCWGGKAILAENVLQLPALPAAGEIKLLSMVPSAMAELLRMNAIPASVRTVNLAGELLPANVVDQVYQHRHIQQVYNLYGPTEDTTYSTCSLTKAGQPPILGRPLTNRRLYILDAHGQPVPIGVPGEVYVAGAGLSRGYLNRPELTAEKFIPNPFDPQPGARMYRTGDLARFRANGDIEYLGRMDFQVKIRGFRVELGEVEAMLRQHPKVQDTVVVAHQASSGDKQLVAYVVGKEPGPPSAGELRSFLKAELPDYMVPTVFMFLKALPQTPSGKVNRKALPPPAITSAARTFTPPQTELEKELAVIWSQVLGIEAVGREDNFFDLGGHSLLATRAGVRISTQCHIVAGLQDFFEAPTLAAFAALLAKRQGEKTPPAPSLKRLARAAVKSRQ